MTTAAVAAASMAMIVIVVSATGAGIVIQLTCQEVRYDLIAITTDTAVNCNIRFSKGHSGATADTAADEGIHTQRLQKASQRTVAVAAGIHHLRGYHLAVFYIVNFEIGSMAKVLEHQACLISNRNFHKLLLLFLIIP